MSDTKRRWRPSRRWLALPPLLIGVGVVGLLASSQKPLPRLEASESATPLRVIEVTQTSVHPKVVGFGTARPRRTWTAMAEVGGQLTETHPNLRSGVVVEVGEPLLEIDSTDYRLRVDQREAELAQARAELVRTELAVTSDTESLKIQEDLLLVRKDDLERLQQLQVGSAASQREFDSAMATVLQQKQSVQSLRNALTTYPALIESAEAMVRLAESRVAEAQRDVARTRIVAPFRGVLSGVSLEPGQFVGPNQSLFQVLDSDTLEIEAQFSLAQLARVCSLEQAGGAADLHSGVQAETTALLEQLVARVTVRSGDVELSYPARAVRVAEALDERTRTLGLVVQIDNAARPQGTSPLALRSGTYCQVRLTSKEPTSAWVIPRTSVEGNRVWVVGEDGLLARRTIEVEFTLRDEVAVTSGLSDGDQVVIEPPVSLLEGDLIEPLSSYGSEGSE